MKRSLLYTNRTTTQVTLYLIGIMLMAVIFAFIVINIGKTSLDKTYADNAADGGALAAASVMASAFNYNAEANDGDEEGKLKDNNFEHDNDLNEREKKLQEHKAKIDGNQGQLRALTCCDGPSLEIGIAENSADISSTEYMNTSTLSQSTEAYRERQHTQFEDMMKKTYTDDNSYYKLALVAGYKYNFYNSGIQHRLGRINSRRFSEFLQSITPETVQNGVPLSFWWVDGAGRFHIVTAIVEIVPPNTYVVNVDQITASEFSSKMAEIMQEFNLASSNYEKATSSYARASRCCLTCPSPEAVGDASSNSAYSHYNKAYQDTKMVLQRLRNSKDQVFNDASQAEDFIINYVEDIIHPQTVYSSNFQFHMGGPVKGMRGDVDFPTFYPPVQSGAIASFNCKGTGRISAKSGKTSASFDSCLIATW